MRGPVAPVGESGDVRTWRCDAIIAALGARARLRHGGPHGGAHGGGRAQDCGEIGLLLPSAGKVRPAMAGVGSCRDEEAEGEEKGQKERPEPTAREPDQGCEVAGPIRAQAADRAPHHPQIGAFGREVNRHG